MRYKENDLDRYQVRVDHKNDIARLFPVEEQLEDDKEHYQILGEPVTTSNSVDSSYKSPEVEHPSFWEEVAARAVAGSIVTGFRTAETVLETSYNGMRTVVKTLD